MGITSRHCQVQGKNDQKLLSSVASARDAQQASLRQRACTESHTKCRPAVGVITGSDDSTIRRMLLDAGKGSARFTDSAEVGTHAAGTHVRALAAVAEHDEGECIASLLQTKAPPALLQRRAAPPCTSTGRVFVPATCNPAQTAALTRMMLLSSFFSCAPSSKHSGLRRQAVCLCNTMMADMYIAGSFILVSAGVKEVLMAWRLRWTPSGGTDERGSLATEWLSTRPPPRGGLRRRSNQQAGQCLQFESSRHARKLNPPLLLEDFTSTLYGRQSSRALWTPQHTRACSLAAAELMLARRTGWRWPTLPSCTEEAITFRPRSLSMFQLEGRRANKQCQSCCGVVLCSCVQVQLQPVAQSHRHADACLSASVHTPCLQGQNTRGSDQRFLAATAWSHAAPGASAAIIAVLAASSDARLQLLNFQVSPEVSAAEPLRTSHSVYDTATT